MSTEPAKPASRQACAILLALVVLCSVTACSAEIDSTKNPDPAQSGLACVKGHDELTHHSGAASDTTFVCDLYQPTETR